MSASGFVTNSLAFVSLQVCDEFIRFFETAEHYSCLGFKVSSSSGGCFVAVAAVSLSHLLWLDALLLSVSNHYIDVYFVLTGLVCFEV